MRIDQVTDNGNVAVSRNRNENLSHRNINNRSWQLSNSTQSDNQYISERLQYNVNSNYNTLSPEESQEFLQNNSIKTNIISSISKLNNDTSNTNKEEVCNRQYRIYTQNNINLTKSFSGKENSNLAGSIISAVVPNEIFTEETNAFSNPSPSEEERAFEHSDTDEMSENGIQTLPRGIVNPNYPGFQHLAHTLQDYSSTIENFYHSENEMTDDDVDVEITELAYENVPHQTTLIESKNINNNNNNNDTIICELDKKQNDLLTKTLDSQIKNDIPDLIKTISKNNNNIDTGSDFNCTDTDIENNFHTHDIIGDFNKEIEDEIKQLLNYNINIQDDLEELRKDIKDTFAKPIETTINNISEVVNHVIKKLVETKCDSEPNENVPFDSDNTDARTLEKESEEINKENESNTRTEMHLSRPTFLLIENKNKTIEDAHLSDGKDEINIYDSEYDTEKLSNDVETTIKQLSTELRKIIPKLDEMRERDKLWAPSNSDTRSVITDSNSNELSTSSRKNLAVSSSDLQSGNSRFVTRQENTVKCRSPLKTLSKPEPRSSRDRKKDVISPRESTRIAQNNTSVRKNSVKDCDLGSFDVYNIETALPKLDLDAIENHLKAAKEEERRESVHELECPTHMHAIPMPLNGTVKSFLEYPQDTIGTLSQSA